MTCRMRRLFLFLWLAVAGCATSFQGEAKFPGGPRACFKRCKAAGLEMSSFVYVGEYSTGCVCGLKASMRSASASERDATAATSAAAVGVVLQMRRAQAAAAQNAAMTQPHMLPPR